MEKLKKIVEIIDKVNVKNVKIYETKTATPYFDYIIIATVASQRQLNAVSNHIKQESAENNYEVRGVEGSGAGEWVLVDVNDILINVFTQEAREFYDLDRIWKNLPQVEL